MFKWAQGALAGAIGTREPDYGPDAIQTVVKQAEQTPYTELTQDHLKWKTPDSTFVETATFYNLTDDGKVVMSQIIYNKIAGLKTTVQFTAKIFYLDSKTPNFWLSEQLSHHRFDAAKTSLFADKCSVELSADGTSYHIKSSNNPKCIVDVKYTRSTPGFMAGRDGTSYYGTDHAKPWGSMYHAFWPSCAVEGTYTVDGQALDMRGRGVYIHALQGMKPHHAAARWNFITFHSPSYAACMMEFTTPQSYGTTTVNVGAVTRGAEYLVRGAPMEARHTAALRDEQNDWPAPTAARFAWRGVSDADEDVEAVIEGPLGDRLDRVDVMAEVPGFVKDIVSVAAQTKPYIYQYGGKMTLKLKTGDQQVEEQGTGFVEATFIC